MTRPCAVCGAERFAPFLRKNGYDIVRCLACDFLFVHPPPSPDVLRALYTDPAYFQSEGPFGYADYEALRPFWENLARDRLRVIERYATPGTMLDVGCASGIFLHVAQKRGWEVWGVEIAPEAARRAMRCLDRPILPSIDPLLHHGMCFDVITLWEYLEHVLDPRAELMQMNRLLRPEGVLALSTPNAGQREVRRRPAAWREFKPPEHVSFFTAKTLGQLLTSCGFEILEIRPIAFAYRGPHWLERALERVREQVGDRQTRRTPLWPLFSIARHLVRAAVVAHHVVFLSPLDYAEGIEIYARKRQNPGGRKRPASSTTQTEERVQQRRALMYVMESRQWGGAEAYVRHLIEGVDRRAWEVHLVCPQVRTLALFLEWARSIRLRLHLLPGERPHHLPALWRFFRRHRPDVVHFNLHHPFACRYAMLAAWMARVPVRLATTHLPTIPPHVYTWKGRLVLRLAYRSLHRLLVDSETNRDRALSHYPFAAGKLEVIPHGIPLEPFLIEGTRREIAEEFGWDPQAPIVGTVGRLSPQKAVEDFIEAAALVRARIPQARFLIVGEGECRSALQHAAQARDLGSALVFAGYREDVPRLLAAMDVFVLSSLYEGMPLAILEAMAAARPVVATRVDGVPEIVCEGETGLLVPPRAPTQLADAIASLLLHPERAHEMGRRGRERVRAYFTRERMVEQIVALYDRLLERASRDR